MHPVALLAATFGIWIIARGEAPKYWALATTANASKSATTTSNTTSGVAASGTGAAAGTVSPSSVPAVPSLSSNLVQQIITGSI